MPPEVVEAAEPVTSTKVGEPSSVNATMDTKYWQNIRPLRGGSEAMREEGKRLLPQRPREKDHEWNSRCACSFLDPYYDDAIVKTAARPFSEPVKLRGELPPQLVDLEDNIDRRGSSLTIFAHDVLDAGLDAGMTHVFIDFPMLDVETAEEEELLRARPTFVHVRAWDLLGAAYETLPTGEEWMTRCRIHDEYDRPKQGSSDPYAVERIERVRVYNAPMPKSFAKEDLLVFKRLMREEILFDEFLMLEGRPGSVQVWERRAKKDDEQYTLVGASEFRYPGIPLFTFYTARTGRLRAKPYFWKIAELNLEHWIFRSVHGDYVDLIQVAGWKRTGIDSGNQHDVTLGHRRISDLEAGQDLETIEHKGTAYEAGKDYLERRETRMQDLSLDPNLDQRPGDITATGDIIKASASNAQIDFMLRHLENVLTNCYRAGATWMNVNRPNRAAPEVKVDPEFRVDIFSGFARGAFSQQETQALKADVDADYITVETYLEERKKRGGYSDTMEPEAEARAAQAGQMERTKEFMTQEREEQPSGAEPGGEAA